MDYQKYCVKLYFPKFCTPEREKKIHYMAKNPPQNLESEQHIICWAKQAVYENAQFVGFMMPLAFENSIQLYELCMPNIKKNLPKIWHDKYNHTK